jgi:hypothetical protein
LAAAASTCSGVAIDEAQPAAERTNAVARPVAIVLPTGPITGEAQPEPARITAWRARAPAVRGD